MACIAPRAPRLPRCLTLCLYIITPRSRIPPRVSDTARSCKDCENPHELAFPLLCETNCLSIHDETPSLQ